MIYFKKIFSSLLLVFFMLFLVKERVLYNSEKYLELRGQGLSPTLVYTLDFSTNSSVNTTPLNTATLKTFLESFDTPNSNLSIVSTDRTYIGSGSLTDEIPDDNWKFSSSSANGSAQISGLPSYGYIKIWIMRWNTDNSIVSINNSNFVSITDNTKYSLFEFDNEEGLTTFSINSTKRFLVQKIEFWSC